MSRAKDLVEMIERYSAKVKSIEKSSEKNEHADEMSLLNSLMLDMGIISPVTRENAGSALSCREAFRKAIPIKARRESFFSYKTNSYTLSLPMKVYVSFRISLSA
uniref:AlNc14C178G8171 protein n=1 Tax=Albugo laibachii Nc14 TaxID=890382 RepID=F0WP18_9STRA|nr:AlNc14C178G8171 [Albugo laibachii Nc14]|eukprot:CCA23062.1 AlNc14C178G8171 [Albugo laibachii Nc14]